jgi:chromosome transmission fidelity protein 4
MPTAAGRSFVAVATSAHLLRLYSPAGRQLAAVCLPGPPAGLAASGHWLLSAHHASPPIWEGDGSGSGGGGGAQQQQQRAATQRLAFSLLDAARQAEAASGPLPLGRGAALAWLGFTDEGLPAAYDGAGVMRVRTPEWGGAWAPVFDARAARQGAASAGAGGDGRRCFEAEGMGVLRHIVGRAGPVRRVGPF